MEGTAWSSELTSEYLLGSLLPWLCWCQIEPTIHFAVWVCTSWSACEGCMNISSNHTLVSQISLFFFPFFLFPSLFFIIYYKFWTQIWVGSQLRYWHGKHRYLSAAKLRAEHNYYKILFSHINYYLQFAMSSSYKKEWCWECIGDVKYIILCLFSS